MSDVSSPQRTPEQTEAKQPLMAVEHLRVLFPIKSGVIIDRKVGHVHAVDDVSFHLDEGCSTRAARAPTCGAWPSSWQRGGSTSRSTWSARGPRRARRSRRCSDVAWPAKPCSRSTSSAHPKPGRRATASVCWGLIRQYRTVLHGIGVSNRLSSLGISDLPEEEDL